MPTDRADAEVLVLTADARVTDAVESAAAALGVAVVTVATMEEALPRWPRARVVLVGGDLAAAAASVGPPRRGRVHLVGFEAAELGTWSMPLGAEVLPLPQGLAWLTEVLAVGGASEARTLAVVGGSGGVGASTLASGLALAGARAGRTVALADLDPHGGGVDRLLGAERAPGWRWPRLAGARGEVGDVRGVLPEVAGVTVVSMGRGPEGPALSAESVQAVLGSLGRHHDLVVVDAGRTPHPAARQGVRAADAVLLLSGTGVRAVAAAASLVPDLGDRVGVVVRRARGGPPGELVSDALGLPLWGEVPEARRVAADAERGELPGASSPRWGSAVGRLLERVWTEAHHED
ncbi:MAG: P-loop NTPase [Propionibacteriaceae bacterium]|nr:P-loop NTPase [Propionibacteriaceae bacterium]